MFDYIIGIGLSGTVAALCMGAMCRQCGLRGSFLWALPVVINLLAAAYAIAEMVVVMGGS